MKRDINFTREVIGFWLMFIFVLVLSGCGFVSQPPTRTEDDRSIVYTNVAEGKTEVSGFEFPFVIDVEDLNNSTMPNGKNIIIQDPSKKWADKIEDINTANGWILVNEPFALDGGSKGQTYFFAKGEPMVMVFNSWDMNKGKFVAMNIRLIHPSDVPRELIDIRSDKIFSKEDFNVEELLGCSGLVGMYQEGVYACIEPDGRVIELY